MAVRALREKLAERTAMIEELLWAMHLWSQDEDETIHPDAWASFEAACTMVGVAFEEIEGSEMYHFADLDWVQRQRDRWRRRQGE